MTSDNSIPFQTRFGHVQSTGAKRETAQSIRYQYKTTTAAVVCDMNNIMRKRGRQRTADTLSKFK